VNELYEYMTICIMLSPLIFFIIAVSFRILDNSALLFLKQEILVDSANLSLDTIKEQIQNSNNKKFTRKLKRALIFRTLHHVFLSLVFISLVVLGVLYFFF